MWKWYKFEEMFRRQKAERNGAKAATTEAMSKKRGGRNRRMMYLREAFFHAASGAGPDCMVRLYSNPCATKIDRTELATPPRSPGYVSATAQRYEVRLPQE